MRRTGRWGRPPRELAGEVEERIIQAATKVFLDRGLGGATIDEIAEQARAGKPTIYARFPNKEALFAAAMVWKRDEKLELDATVCGAGLTAEQRLKALATAILETLLLHDNISLMRATAAEARRFPELASSVHRMNREHGNKAIGEVLREFARADGLTALPAFEPDRLLATAQRFSDVILLPIIMRAIFGEDLAAVRADIGPHVEQSAAFFLAAVCSCKYAL